MRRATADAGGTTPGGDARGVLHAFELERSARFGAGCPHRARRRRAGCRAGSRTLCGAGSFRVCGAAAAVPRRRPLRLRLVYRPGALRTVAEGLLARYRGDFPAGWAPRDAGAAEAVARARLSLERTPRPATTEAFGTPPDRAEPERRSSRSATTSTWSAPAPRCCSPSRAGGMSSWSTMSPTARSWRRAGSDRRRGGGLRHRAPARRPAGGKPTRRCGCWRRSMPQRRRHSGPRGRCAACGPRLAAPWLCRLERAPDARRHAHRCRRRRPARGCCAGMARSATSGCRRQTCRTRRRADDARERRCVGLTRAAAELVRDSGARYPNPDVMLAEAVQRLRAEGREVATLLRCRFVRYAEAPATASARRSIAQRWSWS